MNEERENGSRASRCSSRFMPERDPVAWSSKQGSVGPGGETVTSAICGNNADLMENVGRLWIKDDDVIADVTYGRGVFWKRLAEPAHCHDLKSDGVNCCNLPHDDQSLDVVVFDPPYRPTHGSKGFKSSGNGLAKAYQLGGSHLDTINDVLRLYEAGIKEAHRVLKTGGRIMVKCQDMSYGHRLHLVSLDILRQITEAGFEFADQFILANNARLQSGAWKRQERARRSHSVLWVGIKTNAKDMGRATDSDTTKQP